MDEKARSTPEAADAFLRAWLAYHSLPFEVEGATSTKLAQQIKQLDDLQTLIQGTADQQVKFMAFQENEVSPLALSKRVTFRRARATEQLVQQLANEQVAALQDAMDAGPVERPVDEVLAEVRSKQAAVLNNLESTRSDSYSELIQRTAADGLKWKNRMSLLQREPVAVLVGSVLLVVLSGSLIFAMFFHTPIPEVLSSMVLLILGYFFGQTTSGKRSDG